MIVTKATPSEAATNEEVRDRILRYTDVNLEKLTEAIIMTNLKLSKEQENFERETENKENKPK